MVIPDGRIVAVGRTGPFGLFDFGVLVLQPNGAVDATFGLNGLLQIDFGGFNDEAYAVANQADGRIVVGGIAQMAVGYDFALVRLEGAPADVTPPSLILPPTTFEDGASPAGALVAYSVQATDDMDPNPLLSCSPLSGSVFPLLVTTVECTATDAAGNSATGTFDVIVKDANWQLEDVIGLVQSWNPGKLGTSLTDKLSVARRFNAEGKLNQACDALASLLNRVAAQASKGLRVEQATDLITRVTRIRDVIGC